MIIVVFIAIAINDEVVSVGEIRREVVKHASVVWILQYVVEGNV